MPATALPPAAIPVVRPAPDSFTVGSEPDTPRPRAATSARRTALRQAAAYTVLALGAETGIGLAFRGSSSPAAPLLSILVPVLAVVAVTLTVTPRGQRRASWAGVGLRRAGVRWWPAAILVPALIITLPYLVAWMFGLVTFHDLGQIGPDLLFGGVVFSVVILGEEIGWRGFLLPRLREVTSPRRAAVLTGLLHGLFHVPLITLTSSYDSVGSPWLVVPIVVVTITAAGVFYAWLWERGASVWPVAIAHNAVNTVIDAAATTTLTTSPVALSYVAGESGLVTMAAVLLVAAVLLRRSTVARMSRRTRPLPARMAAQ